MRCREDETLEGNYATDFSPYATWVACLDHFFIGLHKCHFLFLWYSSPIPTDLKHECLMFLMRLHRLSLVGLLLHLCHHLELTIHPWWLPYQCLQVLQSSAATQVRIQKGLSAQGPTGPEMKLAYCWKIWGALYDSSSTVLARPTLFFLCAENYLVFGEHSKVRRSEKAGFLLSWTKSSIILSRRNIDFVRLFRWSTFVNWINRQQSWLPHHIWDVTYLICYFYR